jgi:hypothetical protein
VVDTPDYDMIFGNDWLEWIQTVIDLGKRKMKFTWKNRTLKIPINLEKGIHP